MSSRANTEAALERRIRRLAQRRGLSLLISRRPTAQILAHGGYMLREDDGEKIAFGNARYDFSATLEEIEAFLAPEDDA